MNLQELHAMIDETNEKIEALTKQKIEYAKRILGSLIDSLSAHGVIAIRWVQYTPYFNDGDACYFTVHEPMVKFADTKEQDGDWEDGFLCEWDCNDKEQKEIVRDIENILHKKLGEDILEELFDDHAMVVITKDGVEVHQFDHE